MTVIGIFETSTGPLFVGDFLLSHRGPLQKILLPTIGIVTDSVCPPSASWTPKGLRSKLAIVSPTLAIAWAGDVAAADRLVTSLQMLAIADASFAAIRRQIASSVASAPAGLSVLGCYLGEQVKYFAQGPYAMANEILPGFQRGFVAGSGHRHLLQLVGSAKLAPAPSEVASELSAVQLVGLLTQAELASPTDAFAAGIGGGYELIVRREDGFGYYDELAFLFWGAEVVTSGGVVSDVLLRYPYKATRVSHAQSITVVRNIGIHVGPPMSLEPNEVFYIMPFDALKSNSESSLPVPTFAGAPCLMNSFLVRDASVQPDEGRQLVLQIPRANTVQFATIFETDAGINFRASTEWMQDVKRVIAEAWTANVLRSDE